MSNDDGLFSTEDMKPEHVRRCAHEEGAPPGGPVCVPCTDVAGEVVPNSWAHQRIWHDSAGGTTVCPADPVAHSAEAMNILRSEGVAAYEEFLAR